MGRELVDYMRGVWQVSIRRACEVLTFRRSTCYYKSRRPSQAALRKRIREIAETRVRYGYRRIHVLMARVGWQVNHKRVPAICRGRPANPQKTTEAEGRGEAAQGPSGADGPEPGLVHGLSVR